eukprot:6192413-Pleurochrysis_carterae.AAC.6
MRDHAAPYEPLNTGCTTTCMHASCASAGWQRGRALFSSSGACSARMYLCTCTLSHLFHLRHSYEQPICSCQLFRFLAHASACWHTTRGMVQSEYPAAMVRSPSEYCRPAYLYARVHEHATARYAMDAYALQNAWTLLSLIT